MGDGRETYRYGEAYIQEREAEVRKVFQGETEQRGKEGEKGEKAPTSRLAGVASRPKIGECQALTRRVSVISPG